MACRSGRSVGLTWGLGDPASSHTIAWGASKLKCKHPPTAVLVYAPCYVRMHGISSRLLRRSKNVASPYPIVQETECDDRGGNFDWCWFTVAECRNDAEPNLVGYASGDIL